MRAADRLVIADHVVPFLRGLTLLIALGFACAWGLVLGGEGGDFLGRALVALLGLLILAVLVGFGLGTRTTVFDRAAGTVCTSFRVFGRDLFARTHPLADFARIRAFHVQAHREWSFRIHLVGPGRSLRIHRSGFAGPARAALASVAGWLGWPVDDEAGLLAPPAQPGPKP